ncbi:MULTISPECIES: DoxX family protein [Chitinophagaceae]
MKREKYMGYWVVTGLLCFCLLGGIGQLFQVKQIVDGFTSLGYPAYFISIIGFWKVMAIAAVLVPRFPLVKEWAYAGIFFVMTGASASHIVVHDSAFHIIVPLVIALLAVCSWKLRPPSRMLRSLDS